MEIILIRHGKPISASNLKVDACGYAKWIRQYNASNVAIDSRPTTIHSEYKSLYTLSSDLKRAIHSAVIYSQKTPDKISKHYREMEIPRYKLPFRLKTWHWVYLSRVLWMLGVKGPFESYKEAKHRADVATNELIRLALEKNQLVLFGHGFMNLHIRKSLIKQGWTLTAKSNAYWGVTSLIKDRE